MRVLLDTHTFIWWNTQSSRLPSKVFSLIRDDSNSTFVSFASVWEIQIKMRLGKLTLPTPLPRIIEYQQQSNQIELLPIALPHIFALDNLPLLHRDPFDRLLIAQAKVENLTLLSHDPVVAQYPVEVIW